MQSFDSLLSLAHMNRQDPKIPQSAQWLHDMLMKPRAQTRDASTCKAMTGELLQLSLRQGKLAEAWRGQNLINSVKHVAPSANF